MKNLVTKLQRLYNENFIVNRSGQILVVFNTYSKSTQERLLASNFGMENEDAMYNFITLIKTLGAIYSSVNQAVLAQKELEQGLKQGGRESVVCFLERIQETFSQAYGPAVGWSVHHRKTLIESVVKGVCNRRLADLIVTYQIPVPFSFIYFRDVVVQFAQRVPNITPERVEVHVTDACYTK